MCPPQTSQISGPRCIDCCHQLQIVSFWALLIDHSGCLHPEDGCTQHTAVPARDLYDGQLFFAGVDCAALSVACLVRFRSGLMHTLVTRNDQRQAGTRAGAGAACLLPNGWLVLWTGLLWRLLVALMVTPVMGQATATATSSSTFFSALTDPRVSLIQIPPDNFALIPEQW